MPIDKALLDAVGVTSERLFGYLYAGVRLTHALHRGWDRVRGRTDSSNVTSTISYLRLLGVNHPEDAYVEMKDSFVTSVAASASGATTSATDARFFHAHGEVHFLYLLTIAALGSGLFVAASHTSNATPWFFVALGAEVAALLADIRLHSAETLQMRRNRLNLITFLIERGYLPQSAIPSAP